jgi:uncharacterized Zn-finger protein
MTTSPCAAAAHIVLLQIEVKTFACKQPYGPYLLLSHPHIQLPVTISEAQIAYADPEKTPQLVPYIPA